MISVITLTFGDAAENHVGMEQLGKKADKGFSYDDLIRFATYYQRKGKVVELVNLKCDDKFEDVWLMIVRKGFDKDNELNEELKRLNWDTKALMRGKVVNKHARYNLCYGDDNQEPDYINGKGRIMAFDNVPWTKHIHDNLHLFVGDKAKELVAEGNMYYNPNTCGIGWHG